MGWQDDAGHLQDYDADPQAYYERMDKGSLSQSDLDAYESMAQGGKSTSEWSITISKCCCCCCP